ncbi:hypothetical protein [Flavobacterium chilense]|uniref:Lipoprotein n=1 Tax=Flavobacterium chilense TaxID=946677 RepID=A0A1M6XAC8_9FLAO|nr:hypothetical protein [Flavobacterium chilense]SHL02932.1 hypothetical protein SAMN05444484_10162 [Flavobacterium chilense]
MSKNRNLVLIIGFALQSIMSSCKKNEEVLNKEIKKKIEYKIEFPDTVYVNDLYSGVINYKSILDTITTSFDDKKKNRYVLFYLTIVDKPDPDYIHLKKVAKKFGADNNKEISIYDVKFTKPGINYIDGIINDCVIIDTGKKDKNGSQLVRLIENEERITRKVIVINRQTK